MTKLQLLYELLGFKKLSKENQNEIDELVEEAVQKYKDGASDAYTMVDRIYSKFQLSHLDEASEHEIKNNMLLILKKEAGYFITEDFDFSFGQGFSNSFKGSIKENYTLKEVIVTGADSIQGPDSNRFTSINKRTKSADGLFRNKPEKKKQDKDELDIDKKLEALKNLFNNRNKKKITLTDIRKILQSESMEFRSNVKSKMLTCAALIEDEPDCKQELIEHYFLKGNILNESSGGSSSSMSWSNWQGVEHQVSIKDGYIIASNTFLARKNAKISQDEIDYLISKGVRVITENKQEEAKKAKEIVKHFIKQTKGNEMKVHKLIKDNIVNNPYVHNSNSFVTAVWNEFKKAFPS